MEYPFHPDRRMPARTVHSRRSMLLALLVFLLALGSPVTVGAAPAAPASVVRRGDGEAGPGLKVITRLGTPTSPVPTYVPPPADVGHPRAQAAAFTVQYSADFPTGAKSAFQYAVEIWQTQLTSSVPIVVVANWEVQGAGILGSAGPTTSRRDFTGAPVANTFYPIALANKLAGSDLAPNETDIESAFNSQIDWTFTTGITPTGKISFVSTAVHEIGHGLGFAGALDVQGGLGIRPEIPFAYDRFSVNEAGQSLLDFPNNSAELATQLQSDKVFWNGPTGKAANNDQRPKLFAPTTWQEGSSYSHLDETTYPDGSPNSLMTPSEGPGETVYDPGAITRGIFTDMGWTTNATSPGPAPGPRPNPGPSFSDVPANHPYYEAITNLSGRNIIRGFDAPTCARLQRVHPCFGPEQPTLRAQMAALITRANGWENETGTNPFQDRGGVDDALWRNVGYLATLGVVKGYPDAACQRLGRPTPCYLPAENVLYAQAISFITRAMVSAGKWQFQPDNPALYPNVPADSGHRVDLATYVHYVGAVPETTPGAAWPAWNQASSRAWFAGALYKAIK